MSKNSPAFFVFISNQHGQFYFGTGLLVDAFLQLFQRPFDLSGLFPIFPSRKLFISHLVHFLFDQNQNFVHLFYQVHFFNKLAFLEFLDLHQKNITSSYCLIFFISLWWLSYTSSNLLSCFILRDSSRYRLRM